MKRERDTTVYQDEVVYFAKGSPWRLLFPLVFSLLCRFYPLWRAAIYCIDTHPHGSLALVPEFTYMLTLERECSGQ